MHFLGIYNKQIPEKSENTKEEIALPLTIYLR
ncbi:hypothetical protein HBNCFIEN_00533 [Legionella sp. PC997]|nr:hypothetical protein HBNCFIEN_00533 [Legionella sp. PC997]